MQQAIAKRPRRTKLIMPKTAQIRPKFAKFREETGLTYFGARYFDSKISRWLSSDPALAEYVPVAPLGDNERTHNSNLPGMGGVYNLVNLHVYHYGGNNPVKYVDPDGRKVNYKKGIDDVYVKYEEPINDKQGEMLKPGQTYPSEGDARIDGVIAYNKGKGEIIIFKINDSEKKSPFKPINIKVRQKKDGSYKFSFKGMWDRIKNWGGGLKKGEGEVPAGTYSLDELYEGHDLLNWYEGAMVEPTGTVKEWENDRERRRNEKNTNNSKIE